MPSAIRKAAAETLATFLFVFTIIGALSNAGEFAPIAIGLALTVLVYAFGHISGGHLNPAVSLGAMIRGALPPLEFVLFVVGQAVGAALAALLASAIFPSPAAPLQVDTLPAFVAELTFAFALVFVVLNSATSNDNANNSFYGLAIGGTVLVGALTVGAISGGAFNPAVAFGLSLSGTFAWSNFWLYLTAPLVGAALASLAFRALSPRDFEVATA